jgi:hypothetical protein
MGTEKKYLVLTLEKIEDIFRDLEIDIENSLPYISESLQERNMIEIKRCLQFKKQELLKSIK